MYVFHEHKYIIAGSQRECGAYRGGRYMKVCGFPPTVEKNRLKYCFTVILPVLYPLKRINRDAVWRSVLHVDKFDLIR